MLSGFDGPAYGLTFIGVQKAKNGNIRNSVIGFSRSLLRVTAQIEQISNSKQSE